MLGYFPVFYVLFGFVCGAIYSSSQLLGIDVRAANEANWEICFLQLGSCLPMVSA